ncbi:MAG: glycerophosphodiester phosphodiesterase [Betaproteobacteria bacterium]|nr:glycerophosphodiester phosphodiesterase [Betaproteobacteria bacterium]
MAVDLQGHRGARGLAPENTLPAFARALALGVDTLELDTGVTRDGVVVIHHDLALNPDIARDQQGRWLEKKGPPLHSLAFAQLLQYDVGRLKPGTNYAKAHPDQQPVDGTRIPRLADLFEMVRQEGNQRVRFNIEIKSHPEFPDDTLAPEAFAQALLAEIRRAGMSGRTTIQSFDWRALQAAQRIAPEIPTVYLTAQQNWLDNIQAGRPEGSRWTAGVQFKDHGSVPAMVKAAGGAVWSPYFGDVDAAKMQAAKALGLKVVVWTVTDPAAAARMLDLGVDGIISDRPDLMLNLLQQRGERKLP